ncbi:MAG: ATP-dependent helicase [Candidatus Colwellbacteria bacterium]|nr:ATP-dependent helicase [Candidatus Colwellbacteria bacterium]
MKMSSKFEAAYKRLNPEQKKAVDTIEGPVMVIAGPGSGKTELLSLRVMNILRNVDVTPGNILCLTFTEAAAFNMRQRLTGLLGQEAYRVAIHTFHSFGVEIINRYPEHFYGGVSFLPADDFTQTEILEEIFSGLDYGNPLRSEHNSQFVYLQKARQAIEYIKKAGLTPAEFKNILAENEKAIAYADPIVQAVFKDRISPKTLPVVLKAVSKIRKCKSVPLPGFFEPLSEFIASTLSVAVRDAQENNSTGPITQWKKNWTERGDDKLTHLADLFKAERIEALSEIYVEYAARMREEGYYDYNDMILDTIAMLERNVGVKLDLQEQYQYILVDEFQDTNNAQMRLLRLLTGHEIHEGRPNVMVVGDDDQAIYKFQGAEISNIIDFRKTYRDPSLIVLTRNYRSTQDILDAARHIIKKGMGQLQNILPDVKKELVSANRVLKDGAVYGREFVSRDVQYRWIAEEVKKLIKKGVLGNEVAIIAREHKELEDLVPYFHAAKVPVSYERQDNVLLQPHIRELFTMVRFVDSIMKKSGEADNLLPEILSYPFWSIERSMVWELSIKARRERKQWLTVMRERGGKFKEIADFFIDLGARATYGTAEEIFHELVGGPQQILPDEDSEDETIVRHEMFSPFRSYYFSKDRVAKEPAEYMRFLSSLQSFVAALREYHRGRPVLTADMLNFIDMHLKNNLAINNVSQFVNANDAVQFMSAHKAKGLEFEAVFVINCQEDIWGERRSGRSVPLPMNLSIKPAGDNLDDKLRLFYVAMTRAKRLLYLTSYNADHRGKDSARLGFLSPSHGESELFKSEFVSMEGAGFGSEELAIRLWNPTRGGPFVSDEKALLKPLLQDYHLSVTHLQNFLNVAGGGPLAFFEKNLLRFPEPKSPSGAYGSAIHNTIQFIYTHFKSRRKLPLVREVIFWFEEMLKNERLNEKEFRLMLKRGQRALEAFYTEKKSSFSLQDKIEFNFRSQGVVVGDAHITGKIDKITISNGEMTVCDFKTGKAIRDWSPSDSYEKIKAWRYREQLVFYKLLIENSRDFGGKYSVNDGIIQFVEPSRGQIIDLPAHIEKKELERMKALISVVYDKIKSLDFPDIAKYPKDMNGIMAFEDDLLKDHWG